MKCAQLVICVCSFTSFACWAEEKTLTVPVPNAPAISEFAAVIYCDTVAGALLGKVGEDIAHRESGGREELYASVYNRQSDRLVIEISGQALYVHHREDYEKGDVHWGRMFPLDIQKGRTREGIIAYGYSWAPKSASVSVFSLNRVTSVGLWTLTKDTLWAKEGSQAKNYPASFAVYLSCGSRKE